MEKTPSTSSSSESLAICVYFLIGRSSRKESLSYRDVNCQCARKKNQAIGRSGKNNSLRQEINSVSSNGGCQPLWDRVAKYESFRKKENRAGSNEDESVKLWKKR